VETTQLDMERIVSDSILFRATTNATYLNDKKTSDLRQDFSFYHTWMIVRLVDQRVRSGSATRSFR